MIALLSCMDSFPSQKQPLLVSFDRSEAETRCFSVQSPSRMGLLANKQPSRAVKLRHALEAGINGVRLTVLEITFLYQISCTSSDCCIF